MLNYYIRNGLFFFLLAIYMRTDVTNAQRSCPVGWGIIEEVGICYKTGVADVANTWEGAQAACRVYSADLYYVQSESERETLKRLVRGNANPENWLGGFRRADGAWIWSKSNDTKDKQTYIQDDQITWDVGKPDGNGDCLFIQKNGTFRNGNCNERKAYMCKRPIGLSTGCDTDDLWEPVDKTCIKTVMTGNKLNYEDARSYCLNNGGDLLVVKSDAIQLFLKDWYKLYKRPFWIGLSDKNGGSGNLEWVDNRYPVQTNFWAPGQPQFIQNGTGGNCTIVNDIAEGRWSIDACSNTNFYSCERVPGECPENWIPFKNKCYLVNADRQKYTSWYEASKTCSNYGANLITIFDKYTQNFLVRELKSTYSLFDFWIGLAKLDTADLKLTWVTGQDVVNFTNWLPGQPLTETTRDNCVSITNPTGYWYVNFNCFQKLPFICEIDADKPVVPNPSNIFTVGGTGGGKPCVFPFIYQEVVYYSCISTPEMGQNWCSTTALFQGEYGFCQNVGICDGGWTESQYNCFRYFESSSPISYKDAKSSCQSNGGYLAILKNKNLQAAVDNLITSSTDGVWFGLESTQSGGWQWSDNSPLDRKEFNNWRLNHPNKTTGRECGVMDTSGLYFGEWMSIDCTQTYKGYVCQKASTGFVLPTFPTPTFTTPSAKCGPDWIERPFSNFCYHFSTSVATFINADEQCQAIGGRLTSIISSEEQLFIQNIVASQSGISYWIGANRPTLNSGWSWIESSPFIFTNWAQGGYNSSKQCAVLTKQLNSQWTTSECDDIQSDFRFNFICKKLNSETSTITTTPPSQPDLGCEQSWSPHQSSCYKLFNSLKDQRSFDEAKAACRQERADLVEIFDQLENEFLVGMLRTRSQSADQDSCSSYINPQTGTGGTCINKDFCPNAFYVSGLCGEYNDPDLECCLDTGKKSAWIGMYDEVSDSNQISFKLVSGKTPTYTNWASLEPNTFGRCVSIQTEDKLLGSPNLGKWSATSCSLKNGFFCKKPIKPEPKSNGIGAGGVIAILIACLVVISVSVFVVLVVLRRKKIVQTRIPVVDSVAFSSYFGQETDQSVRLANPSFDAN